MRRRDQKVGRPWHSPRIGGAHIKIDRVDKGVSVVGGVKVHRSLVVRLLDGPGVLLVERRLTTAVAAIVTLSGPGDLLRRAVVGESGQAAASGHKGGRNAEGFDSLVTGIWREEKKVSKVCSSVRLVNKKNYLRVGKN